MSDHPKYLADLEHELASKSLSELLGGTPQVDQIGVQNEKNKKKLKLCRPKKLHCF